MKKILPFLFLITNLAMLSGQGYMLIPMDDSQTNHLKAYGIAFRALQIGREVHWLLNYRGGSFAFVYDEAFRRECNTRNIKTENITAGKFGKIQEEIANPEANMDDIKLEVAPRVAVYTPKENERGETIQPWDDAVTLALTYAEIPFTVVYDDEVLGGELSKFDWLHLHHEDFTGMYGKFYSSYNGQKWYRDHVSKMEGIAAKHGFKKVSQLKLAVVTKVREFVAGGGFMFAMCSAADTYDIALAAYNTDICESVFDGDPMAADAENKLDFDQTFAFKNFEVVKNPMIYEHSDIDASQAIPPFRMVDEKIDYFTLFDFSAKWDPVPTMLTQCHTRSLKGFMGQSTAYRRKFIKSNILLLGENRSADEARYIHGNFQRGTWTFYGGHDPEDYRHYVGDPPTDLALHPNSPGYRLILNNILFPAAKKKKQKT